MVDSTVVLAADREQLWQHVREACPWYAGNQAVGSATGNLYRFGRECSIGDYVLYYDPPNKHVRVCRIVSDMRYRAFDLEDEEDIWHYREVEYPIPPIPILDFHGSIKGGLLSPRGTFWNLDRVYNDIDHLAHGRAPHLMTAPDPEMSGAYDQLNRLVVNRAEALTDRDWEWLVVDWLKAQGAQIDERRVGGTQSIIDAEAAFDHGELGEEIWRVQVKRYQNRQVDWPAVERDASHIGDAHFCYVSVFGFTKEARERADADRIVLLEAADFTRFLLGGKLRAELKAKLKLPFGL